MLQEIVQKNFKELSKGKNSSLKYQAMYEGVRVMVDVEKIVPLFEGPCGKKSCEEKTEVGVLTVTYQCKNGHRDVWHSSKCFQPKVGRNCLFHQLFSQWWSQVTRSQLTVENLSLGGTGSEFTFCLQNFISENDEPDIVLIELSVMQRLWILAR